MENLKADLNSLIFQTNQPILIRDFLEWEILHWNLDKWSKILENENLEFRCGTNEKTETPQWERTTQTVKGKFRDLIELTDTRKWLYFDYKYLKEWLLHAAELREIINFKDLGLEVDVNNSTIWMGTKGAHTPCHSDTYGCNVVVQIYGEKKWLLFPFSQDLKPTRIPYEESSIYSELNFFSPKNLADFKDIRHCRIVTLKPGDVLIVPHKWWHYVENLEFSISINTWLPLEQDDEERQSECLVQILTGVLAKMLNKEQQEIILNPNSDYLLETSPNCGTELFNNLLKISRSKTGFKTENVDVEELYKKYNFIRKITVCSEQELISFLEQQSKRFSNEFIENRLEEGKITVKKLIHSITHPDVINLIMNELLK